MAAPRRAAGAALPGGGALIFLTVGTQLPFDRLVRAVDAWAATHPTPVFGQIAEPGPHGHRPAHFEWTARLAPEAFAARFAAAALIVGHAGMGSIIGALAAPKPIVILPRRAALGEQRNDHQLATAARFGGRPGVTACADEAAVGPAIDAALAGGTAPGTAPGAAIGSTAAPELLAALRAFIHGGD